MRERLRWGDVDYPLMKVKVKMPSRVWLFATPWSSPRWRTPPGSSIHGIFQARILEWVTIYFSRVSSWPRNQTWVSHIVGRCFYHLTHQGSSIIHLLRTKKLQPLRWKTWIFFFFPCCKTSPKHTGSWWQSLPPGEVFLSLPGKKHPEISCPIGLLSGCMENRRDILHQVKQPSANWTSRVRGHPQSCFTFPNTPADLKPTSLIWLP